MSLPTDPHFDADRRYFEALVRLYEGCILSEQRRAPRNNPRAIVVLSHEADRIRRVLARMAGE